MEKQYSEEFFKAKRDVENLLASELRKWFGILPHEALGEEIGDMFWRISNGSAIIWDKALQEIVKKI